jgi:hypothetical protein
MNYSYRFNPAFVITKTAKLPVATKFNSWRNVVRFLAERKFNQFEAEAILTSDLPTKAVKAWKKAGKPTSGALAAVLDGYGYEPGSANTNKLVMDKFAEEYHLELNDEGVPCRRGTMPGNYHPDRTILVPLGTPLCCDPTSETYWSM